MWPSTIARSTISSRLFAGSITRPLRMIVVLISGEHRLPACSPRQPAANISGLFWVNGAKIGSASCRTLQAGSLRSPEESWPAQLSSCRNSSTEIKNSHAHGQAVGDLVKNDALCAVSDFAVDLDAAIDRPRMHDQAIRLQKFCPLFR